MKSPRLQEDATKAKVFGTEFISVSLESGILTWGILDQLEMYMNSDNDDHEPI